MLPTAIILKYRGVRFAEHFVKPAGARGELHGSRLLGRVASQGSIDQPLRRWPSLFCQGASLDMRRSLSLEELTQEDYSLLPQFPQKRDPTGFTVAQLPHVSFVGVGDVGSVGSPTA